MDYGEPGLASTINELQQIGTRYCGGGTSLPSERKALIIQHEKITLGIISCCEAQFGVARWHQAGVAEFGPWMYQEIKNLAGHVDVIIVSVHAGIEDSPWPSPYIRSLYRSFIDAGATIIHGHHAHVPQGYEEYHNGLIFYGIGNFAVDPVKWGSNKNGLWSIGADIDLNSNPFRWRLITFEIRHNSGSNVISIEESYPNERKHHLKYIEICNRPLHDNMFFESIWQEVAVRAFNRYGGHYTGFLSLNSLGNLIKTCVNNGRSYILGERLACNQIKKQKYLLNYHMLACESHRQMLTTALGVFSGEIKDLRGEESSKLADEMLEGKWK